MDVTPPMPGGAHKGGMPGGPRIFGYPAFAFALFVVAAMLGVAPALGALLRDRRKW